MFLKVDDRDVNDTYGYTSSGKLASIINPDGLGGIERFMSQDELIEEE